MMFEGTVPSKSFRAEEACRLEGEDKTGLLVGETINAIMIQLF